MYSYNSRVSYSQVNENQELTFTALVDYMQDCSCFHSDDVGVGLDYLIPRQLGWFVTNYEIHINRRPHYGEEIVIATYPYQVKGMMAHRIYTISSLDGEILVYGDSLWVLMDLQKARPSRITPEMATAYEDKVTAPQLDFEGCKLKSLEEGKNVGQFTVTDMYIDTNGHMNNAVYIDLTSRFLPQGQYSSIKINYKKAAQLNDQLEVYVAKMEQGYQVILKKDLDVYTIVEYK